MKIRLNKEGNIVIPKNVQKDLGIMPGDLISLETTDKGILLTPIQKERAYSNSESVFVLSNTSNNKTKYFTLK